MRYLREHLDFLREQYRVLDVYKLTDAFNERFGVRKTYKQIKSTLNRYRIKAPCDKDGRHRGLYRNGHRAVNRCKVGRERVVRGGFVMVRTDTGDRMKHHLKWEQYHKRPVPEDHTVIFLDGDKRNFDPENLELLSRRELLMANMLHYSHVDEELKSPVLTLAKLTARVGVLEEGR